MAVKLVHVTTVPMTLEFFLRGQIRHLVDNGFEVIAISSPGEALERVAKRDEIEVHAVPMTRGITPVADLVTVLRLWRLFVRLRPTIVHSSTGKAGPLAMFAAMLARVPIKVYSLRGIMIDRRKGAAKRILRTLELITCKCADRVLGVSRSVAEFMVNEGLCSECTITVPGSGSSNGVEAIGRFNPEAVASDARRRLRTRWGIPEGALVIGFVGRLVMGKGIVELDAAWRSIRTRYDNAYLVTAGPAENQDPVPKQVLEALARDERVVMIDYVNNEEMPEFYRMVDLIVLPTYSEGFPNVLLEAAAMALPVVATRVTGCVDAVEDQITGVLVPPRDADALAAAMALYLDDPELRNRHGAAARERVLRSFRPEPIWDAVLEEYHRLLEAKGLVQSQPEVVPGD